ncbi:MAG TPA: hypothetical protein VE690_21920 [Rhodopila sp.]|nr:hypothetical protein [Rhodopila sp.]
MQRGGLRGASTNLVDRDAETGGGRGRYAGMPYELRLDGRLLERFETPDAAEARARQLIRDDADRQVEIIDLATGRPYAPAAGAADREALSRKVGF